MPPVMPIWMEVTAREVPRLSERKSEVESASGLDHRDHGKHKHPFIPTRTRVSESDASRRTPTNGAAMKSDNRKSPIIILGHPAFSMNDCSFSFMISTCRSLRGQVRRALPRRVRASGDRIPQPENMPAVCPIPFLVDYSYPVADGPEFFKLRGCHYYRRPGLFVDSPEGVKD